MSCGLHGVESADININDIVVVSGCGPVGLSMISGAKHKSPKCLIALDLVDWKVRYLVCLPMHKTKRKCSELKTLELNISSLLRMHPVHHCCDTYK